MDVSCSGGWQLILDAFVPWPYRNNSLSIVQLDTTCKQTRHVTLSLQMCHKTSPGAQSIISYLSLMFCPQGDNLTVGYPLQNPKKSQHNCIGGAEFHYHDRRCNRLITDVDRVACQGVEEGPGRLCSTFYQHRSQVCTFRIKRRNRHENFVRHVFTEFDCTTLCRSNPPSVDASDSSAC